ncbi:GNAT family N-acetyltransferase [Gramella jeungdoensis]|uniref:GNAT family N-acetyltransferase n=1 Tax=Gramella jeungdoensis TaxID=708091 RepID=A0ABT0YYM7_9FLAO|nr:GNAT family N-acetyltransferase [Gramella jeungdoensis]MCM8568578.1 GNAT family N-acetyltransferase [Gramella jeungdoensis]
MKPFELLSTSRTIIRRFQPADRDKLVELLCDRSVTRYMVFPEETLTEDGASELLETTINSYETEKPLLAYAVAQKKDDGLIGVSGYHPLSNNEIEVFYAFLPEYWGKGFATEILIRLTNYVFENGDYAAIVAPITRANKASIRVAEKAGFTNHGLQQHPDYDDLVFMFKKEKTT